MGLKIYPRTKVIAGARGWRSWQQSVKIFFVVSCLAIYYFLIQFAVYQESIQKKKQTVLSKDFKYILMWAWTPGISAPFYERGEGRETFVALNCSFTNCYVTADKNLFHGDLTIFDAILFHGIYMNTSDLPTQRSRYQKYIFFSMESADNYPICDEVFDGFFNLTSTYRLDSDIPCPYILIRDNNGKIVGPKRKMIWRKITTSDKKLVQRTQSKNATAVWFVSNCEDRSGRRKFFLALQNALTPYHLSMDAFGDCALLQCHRSFQSICNDILIKHAYFYMSMENSLDEDYVTEKVLTALHNNVVPIVYGAADYTRFLPPGSYIDGRKHNITEIAAKMNKLIRSPKEYNQYFWWKGYYSYHDPQKVENVCAICEALHSNEMHYRSYYNFRDWWNPNGRCMEQLFNK